LHLGSSFHFRFFTFTFSSPVFRGLTGKNPARHFCQVVKFPAWT
jgi:hypothetical protein